MSVVIRRVLLVLTIFFVTTNIYSQTDWDILTIDNFLSTNVGQGISGLNAVVHDNVIHLTYFYHNVNSESSLVYAVKNGDSFTTETVAQIADFNSFGVSTSIQFTPDGKKWIYAGFYSYPNRIIGVFKENNGEWDYTYLDETGNYKYVRAIQSNTELGFAYMGVGDNIYKQSIKYAYWDNDHWEITTLSTRSDTYKTEPSIIETGGKIYLSFAEGIYPDNLTTYVYMKENQTWQESFSDIMTITYNGGSIDGLHARIGVTSGGQVYLLHDLTDTTLPRFFELNSGTWTQNVINYPESNLLIGAMQGSNLLFDTENALYTISQAVGFNSIISWIKENGEAGYYQIPFEYTVILQDFVILNDNIYVYLFDGHNDYPYNRPITFKELSIESNYLLTDVEEMDDNSSLYDFELHQNFPNPFNPNTEITFTIPSSVERTGVSTKLVIHDLLGSEVTKLVDEQKPAGTYHIQFNAGKLPSGVYFYSLQAGSFTKVRKMILLK